MASRPRLPGRWIGDTRDVTAGVLDAAALMPVPSGEPYCTGCGHDKRRHRSGRCWSDVLGEPVSRSRSLISCTCSVYEEDQ